MVMSELRTLKADVRHDWFSGDDPSAEDSTMDSHQQRSVLRKIAARRHAAMRKVVERPAHLVRLSFRLDGPSEAAPREWGPNVLGPRLLTRRELEVLHLVARGETDQAIADRLYLSRRTVNSHVSHILAKLDVPSRKQAVITATGLGLLHVRSRGKIAGP
jgi:DNA-binding NarL/FixJ family response regulator